MLLGTTEPIAVEYLYEFLLFAAQALVVVVAIIAVIGYGVSMRMQRTFAQRKGHLEVTGLNAELDDLENTLRMAAGASAKGLKHAKRQHKRDEKARLKERTASAEERRRIYVVDFYGDMGATRVDRLRREVTAMLTLVSESDEVVVRLESLGGTVHGYGLAASQLKRIRDAGARLVVAVDKVAASGGYLMASVASHLIAAPFAVLGSIGVVVQLPNVSRLLKKHDVDYELLTAGKYKRTLTVFGENTPEHRAKVQQELEEIHELFGSFLHDNRPQVDLEQVATGETWYGTKALNLQLVDEVLTSDEYLLRARGEADIFEVQWVDDRSPWARLAAQVSSSATRLLGQST